VSLVRELVRPFFPPDHFLSQDAQRTSEGRVGEVDRVTITFDDEAMLLSANDQDSFDVILLDSVISLLISIRPIFQPGG
jgi:spermidine synthase